MPIKVSWNEVDSSCLKIPTLAVAGKFQVFLKYFGRVLISFVVALVASGAPAVCSGHSAI
ncbi:MULTISPECIES: hypothetical protein [Pseudomonas]|uniref:Uncharacterized protein n=1 Tax=Pseudomonas monachiensis TaxID=3060212 RepID=A0ABW9HEI9_9PSED|nr:MULTISPECIES: hypothetical protein [unclassified Pseudomonas]